MAHTLNRLTHCNFVVVDVGCDFRHVVNNPILAVRGRFARPTTLCILFLVAVDDSHKNVSLQKPFCHFKFGNVTHSPNFNTIFRRCCIVNYARNQVSAVKASPYWPTPLLHETSFSGNTSNHSTNSVEAPNLLRMGVL